MGRSGYSDDCEGWDLIRWRGAVASAIRGKRGQAFLTELLNALDAMPVKRLIVGELIQEGEVCTLGVIGQSRCIPMDRLDPYDTETVAHTFSISEALAKEIMFENDGDFFGNHETPEQRYSRMREWVASNIKHTAGGEETT